MAQKIERQLLKMPLNRSALYSLQDQRSLRLQASRNAFPGKASRVRNSYLSNWTSAALSDNPDANWPQIIN